MNDRRRCCIEMQADNSVAVTVSVNGQTSSQCLDAGVGHVVVDIDHVKDTWFELAVTCTQGRCQIGPVKFNHSWQINTVFCERFPDLWDQLARHGFDLSTVSADDLDLIQQHGVFVSSGADVFSSWDELRLNPRRNGQLIETPNTSAHHWFYDVAAPDTVAFDVTVPSRAP